MKHIDQMHRIDPDNIQADSILGKTPYQLFYFHAKYSVFLQTDLPAFS